MMSRLVNHADARPPALVRRAVVCLCFVALTAAQAPLPVIEGVDAAPFRDHCRRLLEAAESLKLLSADERRELRELLRADVSETVILKLQRLLDRHCLVAVNINPESRVKAARGPAAAELVLERESLALIRVHNEAGVTDALKITGPQLIAAGAREPARWLELSVVVDKPLGKTLSGDKLEYVVVRLKPRQAGKREVTLKFDVGQGTQDLGFRAEVPVLFTIKP